MTIKEAISWYGSINPLKKIYYDIWESYELNAKVSLGKFGKEYHINTLRRKDDGSIGNNPNDMKPTIFIDNVIKDVEGSFVYVFDLFQQIHNKDTEALDLLGSLLFRNAFLIDHIFNEDGNLRYSPPQDVIIKLRTRLGNIDGMDIEIFLHYLDAIALNEDVKYYGLGYDIRNGTGRRNNLLTCVHIIAVFLNRTSLVKLCGAFSRPPVGVAPLSNKKAIEVFPMLKNG